MDITPMPFMAILRQSKRDRILSDFRNKKYRILVATDVAARGIDVPHVDHVINYDVPQCPEDYIHRIGRTARAGNQGCSLTFITPEDKKKWHAVDRLLNPNTSQDSPYAPKPRPGKRHPKKRTFGHGTKPYSGHRPPNRLARKKRTVAR